MKKCGVTCRSHGCGAAPISCGAAAPLLTYSLLPIHSSLSFASPYGGSPCNAGDRGATPPLSALPRKNPSGPVGPPPLRGEAKERHHKCHQPCPPHVRFYGSGCGSGSGDHVDIGVSSWRKPAPDTFPALAKCGANYMNSQLAKLEAIDNGFDEAIMLDYEGHVSEGSGENIFLVEGEKLFTPAMSSSNLRGITRDSIMTIARDLGYEVVEEVISRERLYSANEVFFTGTAAEVTPIRSIDHRQIGIGRRGPISEKIQSSFFDIVEAKVDDKYGWLSYI